jgi:hypothetical protein
MSTDSRARISIAMVPPAAKFSFAQNEKEEMRLDYPMFSKTVLSFPHNMNYQLSSPGSLWS